MMAAIDAASSKSSAYCASIGFSSKALRKSSLPLSGAGSTLVCSVVEDVPPSGAGVGSASVPSGAGVGEAPSSGAGVASGLAVASGAGVGSAEAPVCFEQAARLSSSAAQHKTQPIFLKTEFFICSILSFDGMAIIM